ncbi:AAA family ATPase [Sulfurimonas sp.]|uniref:AAA family ATPase n=1 Tax=Sulfurimonas sp. TaxID=2022749 RepID=UPI003D0F7E8B
MDTYSDYDKIGSLISKGYFTSRANAVKRIKVRCIENIIFSLDLDIRFNNIFLKLNPNFPNATLEEDIQDWKDSSIFKNTTFDTAWDRMYEYGHIDKFVHEKYESIYKRLKKFLDFTLTDNKKAIRTNNFIYTPDVMSHIKLIKQGIIDLTKINDEAFDATTKERFEYLLTNKKKREVPNEYEPLRLINRLNLYKHSSKHMGIKDFERWERPCIRNINLLDKETLSKAFFIEGISGSGKTTLAHRISYSISRDNSFYIDLSDEKNIILLKNLETCYQFMNIVQESKGTIILDNINSSEDSISISKNMFFEANENNLLIIYIFKANVYTYLKDFFSYCEFDSISLNILHLQFFPFNHFTYDRKMMIKSFFQYYLSKNKINHMPRNQQITKIEEEFGVQLEYLKYAFEKNYQIESLSIENAKELILKKYKVFFNSEYLQEFKFLFILETILDNSFFVSEDYVEDMTEEFIFLEELVDQDIIYKVEFDTYCTFHFPSKSIAKFIMKYIFQNLHQNKRVFIKKIIEYIKYRKIANIKSMYLIYIYLQADFYSYKDATILAEEITEKYDNVEYIKKLVDLCVHHANTTSCYTTFLDAYDRSVERSNRATLIYQKKLK